ncbi:hypothetical protein [Flavobacterium sp. T12S277]|uniref:hypothetical protein n=1 Tax=Flavobacterium sp. T12S277 TaxID=3402752 RepID=UPI003AEC5FAE
MDINIALDDLDLIITLLNRSIDKINNSKVIYLIKKLAVTYENINQENRELVRKHVKDNQRILLLSISERIAEIAINNKDQDLPKVALFLHSLEDFKQDPRENIIYLSIIWYVCEKLSLNSLELFSAIALLSSSKTKQSILEFAKRPTALKNLNAMGLMATKKNGKIIFEQKRAPWEIN